VSTRAMVVLAAGRVPPRMWLAAATEGRPPLHGPKACSDCPLRIGGELEIQARRALSEMSRGDRETMAAWGCHDGDRTCAGMRRLIHETVGDAR
jgi:hypothetical protein